MSQENITGGAALDALLQTLPANIEKNIMRTALSAGARVFLAEALRNAPIGRATESERQQGFRPGALRRSLRVTSSVKNGKASASVKAGGIVKKTGENVFYAKWVEFGTRPHTIAPRGRTMSIGGQFVAGAVEHPGVRPHPFMRPAADAKSTQAVAAVQMQIRKRLTKEGLTVPPPIPPGEDEA